MAVTSRPASHLGQRIGSVGGKRWAPGEAGGVGTCACSTTVGSGPWASQLRKPGAPHPIWRLRSRGARAAPPWLITGRLGPSRASSRARSGTHGAAVNGAAVLRALARLLQVGLHPWR